MNKYLTEFIGTFFLVFTIGTASGSHSAIAPLAISGALIAMIYAGGHISGAHFNPAVTLAMKLGGHTSTADVVPYVVAQCLSAVLASLIVGFVLPTGAIDPSKPLNLSHRIPQALVVEALFTFALVFVILNVATTKATANNQYFGLAIGSIVLAGGISVGEISGGAFNPAVAIGLSIMGLTAWSNLWIYFIANMGGAMFAAIVFSRINPSDR